MMGSIGLLLIGFFNSVEIGVCSWLRNGIFVFKAEVMTSFANVVIIKIVNSNGLTETRVNYQICQFTSGNLRSCWQLHSLLSRDQKSLHAARGAGVCLQKPDHTLAWMPEPFRPA